MDYKLLLNDFNSTTEKFINFVKEIPEEILKYRPAKNAWTVHEHIIHVVDSEINAFLRLKTILAESGKKTFIIDEEKWTKNLNYHEENISDYLSLFLILRKITLDLLNRLDANLDDNFVIHEQYGKVDIKTWISWYSSKHINDHLDYIQRNINLYNEEK